MGSYRHQRAGDEPVDHERFTDSVPVRLLIGTTIVCTFIILGVLSFAIINTNIRVSDSVTTVERGVTCVLGSIAGREDIKRPDEENVRKSCAIFMHESESNGD